jgi:bla regulator protein BlaR1
MAFLTITTDRFISVLCNTLLHSLWQGLILAAVTGLIVLFTRKSSAAMRYNLLISALALFAIGVGLTFAMQIQESQPLVTSTIVGDNLAGTGAIDINITTPARFTENVFDYLNQHHNTIITIWFLIICVKSIQLVVGLLGVRRLKHTKVNQINLDWYNRLQQLADSLEIKKRIALLESGLAKAPMVIGAFKPVILIPIGLLTALSTEEVEAILVHELAHIKRRDYLVNLLQSLMEIVFFFNPAVLWISQLIKAERENCCDDMALSQSSNKVNYIRALVSCEEYQASVPAYAMAFAGDKNNLVSRVKRIVNNRNHTLNLFEKTVLAVCLVVSGLCMSAFAKKAQVKYIADTVNQVINNIQDQNIEQTNGQSPADSTLNATEPDSAANETAPITTDATLPNQNTTADSTQKPGALKLNLDSMSVHLSHMKINTNVRLDSMKMHMAPIRINLDNMKVKVDVQATPGVDVTADTNIYTVINATTSYKNKYKPYNQSYKPANVHHAAIIGSAPHAKATPTPSPDTTVHSKVKLNRDQVVDGSGLAKLVDKSIKDKNNFKIILNNKELIVDGVKQSEELHQTALKKYTKYPNDVVNVTIAVTNSK